MQSAPRPRQITMPEPYHSLFYRPDAFPASHPTSSIKALKLINVTGELYSKTRSCSGYHYDYL